MVELNSDLEIDQITGIFREVKVNTIVALRLKGLSIREIKRRLGGTTDPVILTILREAGIEKAPEKREKGKKK